MPFEFTPFTQLPEVVRIKPRPFTDERGWFAEWYKRSEFAAHGIRFDFPQDNDTRSTRGVLRGLHFQNDPAAQGKLVRCVVGKVFDVAVDIRRKSPTFGRWVSTTLSADNWCMMWIPPGYAHGALTMSEVAELLYKVTCEFSPENDRSVRWNDPAIGIDWPITDPILSKKDAEAPLLKDVDSRFVWKKGN